MTRLPEKEIKTAIRAVREAAVQCRNIQQDLISTDILQKDDMSPVTVADFASQAIIKSHIAKAFPKDSILAEEDASFLKTNTALQERLCRILNQNGKKWDPSGLVGAIDHGLPAARKLKRFWVLDPVDGTKGFIRGGHFAVALALMIGNQPVLSVIGCPNCLSDRFIKGCIFVAEANRGAYAMDLDSENRKIKLSVNAISSTREARMCEPYEEAHSASDWNTTLYTMLGIRQSGIRMDSMCKYGLVAGGDVSIYVRLWRKPRHRAKIWDHAAGVLLLHEAGGRVTDALGKSLRFSGSKTFTADYGIIATNGHLHQPVLNAVRKIIHGASDVDS